jgi:hypothetical protein
VSKKKPGDEQALGSEGPLGKGNSVSWSREELDTRRGAGEINLSQTTKGCTTIVSRPVRRLLYYFNCSKWN